MRGSQCLHSPSHALYRVFVSPAELPTAQLLARQLLSPVRRPAAVLRSSPTTTGLTVRGFAVKRGAKPVPQEGERPFVDPRLTTAESLKKSGRGRFPRDHEITDPKIMVLENGVEEGPLDPKFVLSKLEEGESLRMYAPCVLPTEGTPMQYAKCKIVDKKADFLMQKEANMKKRSESKKKGAQKELRFGWTIAEHDLNAKMGKLATWAADGATTSIVLSKKKRGRSALPNGAAEELVRRIREAIEHNNCKEIKKAEGSIGNTYTMHVGANPKPAEQKPPKEKPAGGKPAEEKPVEEKPAEEKPVDQ